MSTIIVTRPDGEADPLVAALRQRYAAVRAVPTVSRARLIDPEPLERALATLLRDDWLVVTSASGVAAVRERLAARDAKARPTWPIETPNLAAIGPATAQALISAGLGTPVVAAKPTTDALLDAIGCAADLHGRRVVLARADAAESELPAALRARGAVVIEVVAYRTIEAPDSSRQPLHDALAASDAIVVFASGSAVRGLIGLVEGTAALELLAGVPTVTIGPRTTDEAWAAGLRVVAEASAPTVQGLVDAVEAAVAWQAGIGRAHGPAAVTTGGTR